MTCCFFGHRDAPESIRPALERAIRGLIECEGADCFLVGHNGSFDAMALSTLRRLREEYPGLAYHVVLAYLPEESRHFEIYDPAETVYPEGLELVPRRFAISRRNDWLLRNSDCAVCFVRYRTGGAAQFAEKARKRGMLVVRVEEA